MSSLCNGLAHFLRTSLSVCFLNRPWLLKNSPMSYRGQKTCPVLSSQNTQTATPGSYSCLLVGLLILGFAMFVPTQMSKRASEKRYVGFFLVCSCLLIQLKKHKVVPGPKYTTWLELDCASSVNPVRPAAVSSTRPLPPLSVLMDHCMQTGA